LLIVFRRREKMARRPVWMAAVIGVVAAFALTAAPVRAASSFQAGAASADITPPP
jgi:hypothetical protein